MAKQKKRLKILIIILLFIAYFFIAARPIPRETVLISGWISSLERSAEADENPAETSLPLQEKLLPFTLGSRFGYVDAEGNFIFNRLKQGEIYLSETLWTEYDAEPSSIEIKNLASGTVININSPGGYPLLLDNRIFILGSEQNALSEVDENGNILWTYEFGAPLTCIDVAAGLVLTGSVDGIIEILDSTGRRIFYFEPGGSLYSIILGCALSRDGQRIGIISGIDQQRFLFLERFGENEDYKVVYHEFLSSGFRRPVLISFIDQDRRIVFERSGGLGCYNIRSRQLINIQLKGEIIDIDRSGDLGYFFLIASVGQISHSPLQKELIGIKFPQDNRFSAARLRRDTKDLVFLRAPFKSDDIFIGRNNSMFVTGGGSTLISFDLEER